MIKGAIDYVSSSKIGGWLYSADNDIKGQTVLAFVGPHCVGSGSVDLFRQDLADAGLGDGHVGFNFDVSLPEAKSKGAIVVRLEGSDLALIQRQSVITDEGELTAKKDFLTYDTAAVEWMRGKGWLLQGEFDFLKLISVNGVYDLSLRAGKGEMKDALSSMLPLFELYAQGPVTIDEQELDPGDFADFRAGVLTGSEIPVVAVKATEGVLEIVEGSQLDANFAEMRPMLGAVHHKLAADRVMLIDLRAAFELRSGGTVQVFLPR